MPKKLRSYHSRLLEELLIPEEAAAYVNAALKDSAEMFLEALKDVVQARQVAAVAKQAGVTREHLYTSLSLGGNPTWDTLNKLFGVVGLQFSVTTKGAVQDLPRETNTRRGYRYRATARRAITSEHQMLLPFSSPEAVNLVAASSTVGMPQPGLGLREVYLSVTNQNNGGTSQELAQELWTPPIPPSSHYLQPSI